MPKRSSAPRPTDEQILAYDNVPPMVAGAYLGTSSPTIIRALQQGRAPFGWAALNEETGTYTYNISPGGLVKYKREGGKTIDLSLMQALLQEAVDRILSEKLTGMREALASLEPVHGKGVPS